MKSISKLFYFTTFLWFSSLSFSLHAQLQSDTLVYDVLVEDEIIGDLVVVKNIRSDSSIEYLALSNTNYKILFSFQLSFDYQTIFNSDGVYSSSRFVYKMNEDIKEANWVRCNSNECLVYENDELNKVISNNVGLTGVLLYFNEPSPGDKIFSERYCETFDVEKENNSYIVDFPGGSENQYFYKNGICTRVVVSMLISEIVFKIRNQGIDFPKK